MNIARQENGCPSDDTLTHYGEQVLDAEARAAVDAHIEHCENCDLMVAALRGTQVSRSHYSTSSQSVAAFVRRTQLARLWTAGTLMGRYRILRRMGMGATGVVFAAHDEELQRDVALKVLLDSHVSPEQARARLVSEARLMAKLPHPNVVTVFDVGIADDYVFLAMELVTGFTLKEWLTTQPSQAKVLALFSKVARAVHAGHEIGLVHRDLKPQNILVNTLGEPKVTDFGFAEHTASADFGFHWAGTPAYMAKEVFEGNACPSSDQFALGVCLHEAFVGARPHSGATLDTLREQVSKPAQVHSKVPRRLRKVLERALLPAISDRYPSLEAFALALEQTSTRSRVWPMAVATAVLVAVAFTLVRSSLSRGIPEGPSASSLPSSTAFAVALASSAAFANPPNQESAATSIPISSEAPTSNAPQGVAKPQTVGKAQPSQASVASIALSPSPPPSASASGRFDWRKMRQ